MSVRITERSLYPVILNLLKNLAERYGINIKGTQEVRIPERRYPDILLEIDGFKILVQVKINHIGRLLHDIANTYPQAKSLGADFIGILFPEEVRQIRPEELEKVGPSLLVGRGLVLVPWLGQNFENIRLIDLLESIVKKYVEWKKTQIPFVDYITIATIARETIEELAVAMRNLMRIRRYSDMALAIIGRFDYYKAMLERFLKEDEMKAYIADITAYLLILQLLFLHVVSRKIYGIDALPKIDNPLSTQSDLIDRIVNSLSLPQVNDIIRRHWKVLGALPYILETLRELASERPSINQTLARFIFSIQVLRPEHVKAELFGRIYQLGLPPETRKNLGAFFTRPIAAKILAELAIERWDDKALDPACGSGTLLAEVYQAKLRRAMQEKVSLSSEKLHRLFLEKDIAGIDIMEFAKVLATIHLILQNPYVEAVPMVFAGDGIEKMVFAKPIGEVDPALISIEDYLEKSRKEYESLQLPWEGLDVIIMNPPFVRRERIPPDERNKLDRWLGNIVRGKVGYWAYFFVAADNVIKPGGRLAAVTPEEFFAGKAAESVRRYLFFGEEYDERSRTYIKKYNRVYVPRIIIRSGVEIAFSEGAHYRDYLVVFEKRSDSSNDKDEMVFVVLKKRLDELIDKELEVVNQIENFLRGSERSLSTDLIDARKINISSLISKHIGNLKPLVGLNDIMTQELVLELLEVLAANPTIGEYERNGLLQIRDYNPGQYKTRDTIRGVEDYARRLFISRYGGRGKISFVYVGEQGNILWLGIKASGERRVTFTINKSNCVYSLRSPADVRHMDITGEEECAIIEPLVIPNEYRMLAGLVDPSKLVEAAKDIRQAYNDLASNILTVRRVRLTSPNLYWLSFYSDNKVLSTAVLNNLISYLSAYDNKILTLYLNSSIALIQLLSFVIETEGAWVDLHGEQVWSHVHIPDVVHLPKDVKEQSLILWQNVRKIELPPLYQRIRQKHQMQRKIDELALKMLGLENWIPRLDNIYETLVRELDAMQKTLETSSRDRRSRRSEEEDEDEERGYQTTMDAYFN